MDLAIFRFEVNPETLPLTVPKHGQATDANNLGTDQDSMMTGFNGTVHFGQTHGTTHSDHGLTQRTHGRDPHDEHVSGPIIKVVNEQMFLKMMNERATSR